MDSSSVTSCECFALFLHHTFKTLINTYIKFRFLAKYYSRPVFYRSRPRFCSCGSTFLLFLYENVFFYLQEINFLENVFIKLMGRRHKIFIFIKLLTSLTTHFFVKFSPVSLFHLTVNNFQVFFVLIYKLY